MESRELKGKAIAQLSDQVKRLSDYSYHVRSQRVEGFYRVVCKKLKWTCSCPDHEYRLLDCKHIWAVRFSQAIRQEVQATQVRVIEPIEDIHSCIYCKSSEIVRDGLRHNLHGDIQKWNCKSCGRYFTINIGFEKMHASPQAITSAMQLYFSGESLRGIQKFLRLQGVNVTHVAVYKWMKKYVGLMQKYLDRITPQLSDTWRADEMYVKIRGNPKWLFAMIDDETRFWIAKEVGNSKDTHDATHLFHESADIAGKKPKLLITDGLAAYHEAYLREFFTQARETEHIRFITLRGHHNNNLMERFVGELRDREKIVRGVKNPNSPLLEGYQIYHNYVRPHEGLEGATPADRAGIEIRGKNKWLTIIQNASRKNSC